MSKNSSEFGALVQSFFCRRLLHERGVSPRTIASYRDAFRLLLRYARDATGKEPSVLELADLDAPLILGFLDHLEQVRGNAIRSRNLRLAAIRSFMRYASYSAPASLPLIQRVLAIPMKRHDRPVLESLDHQEVEAILHAPDESTWSGRRDRALFCTLYNSGARVSELVNANVADVTLGRQAYLRVNGKGRKQRVVPLWKTTASTLSRWFSAGEGDGHAPLFPNRFRKRMTRSGVEDRLRCAVRRAVADCPSLDKRRVSPHTFRHTCAMHLLQAGVDLSVIALWLGHESESTTHLYVEADLEMKTRALSRVQPPSERATRYRPPDSLLAFLEGL